MSFRNRLAKVEQLAFLDGDLGEQIETLKNVKGSVAEAIEALKSVLPVNDYDQEGLTSAIEHLHAVFHQIDRRLAERGIPSEIDEQFDGTWKPSHSQALLSCSTDDPDHRYDDGDDPPMDVTKFAALPRSNQRIVREALRIQQIRGKELNEDERGITAGGF